MKKTVIKMLLSFLLVAVVLVGGTLAYLVASDSPLINTFTLAQVSTTIYEQEGAQKAPQVENIGKSPVYVRAKAVFTDLPEGVTVNLEDAYNKNDWVNGGDGFYYYNKILRPSEDGTPSRTEVLFTVDQAQIETDDEFVPNENMSFSIDVYQEAVLAPANAQFDLVTAQAAFKAKG